MGIFPYTQYKKDIHQHSIGKAMLAIESCTHQNVEDAGNFNMNV